MVVFYDGMGLYGGDTTNLIRRWTTSSGGTSLLNDTLYTGSRCIRLEGSSNTLTKTLPATQSTIFLGFRFKNLFSFQISYTFLELIDATIAQVAFFITSGGAIGIRRDTTVLAISNPNLIKTNVPVYIEIKVTFSNTVGVVEIRLNGATVISLSNVNTRNTSNSFMNIVSFLTPGAFLGYDLGDFYVLDTNSPVNNFVGDIKTRLLLANGNGAISLWSIINAILSFQAVNELAPDTTSFIQSLLPAQRSMYTAEDIPLTTVPKFLQVNSIARASSGTDTYKIVIDDGTTSSMSPVQTVNSSNFNINSFVSHENPTTSIQWTAIQVNLLTMGVEK